MFVKSKLESIQNYHWMHETPKKNRVPQVEEKPNVCGYCLETEVEEEWGTCEACAKSLAELQQ